MTHSQDATKTIRAAIRAADQALVAEHPWTGRDDAVALGAFALAVLASCGIGVAWWLGALPTALAVVGMMLTVSVLHELEHDLLHDLYLRNPVARALVLGVIWLFKGNLDPWTRGPMHRWHHVASGQIDDIEERLIGLGLPWGPQRLLLTFLTPASLLRHPALKRAVRARVAAGLRSPDVRAYRIPPGFILANAVLFLAPLAAFVGVAMGQAWAWPLFVLWALPNLLRHAAIVTMSSNSHYVGIDRGDVVTQNQILDHWMFWPLQVFCWNFGATHVLHHFVVRQPFWRRTLVFGRVRQVLVDNGVRANDLGTFGRANHR